jgi:uncharacterized membrane protein YjjP (DUF1212 family)
MAVDQAGALIGATFANSVDATTGAKTGWLRWLASFAAGALAGYIAFFGIRDFGFYFEIPAHLSPLLDKRELTVKEADMVLAALTRREYQNTALQVAMLGAAAGALLGLVEGLARRSILATLVGGAGGLLLGGLAGAAGGAIDLYVLSWLWGMDFDITFKSMAAHSVAFLLPALGIAIVVGLTRRRLLPTVGVVLAAALLAGLIYPGLAAYLWPVENTNAAVPIVGTGPLLLWTMLPAMLMSLAIARTGRPVLPVAA